ncbi:MAG: glycosyltransferase family 2 protein [Ruminococcus sp.]
MKQSLYGIFYSKLKNIKISEILARIAYFIVVVKFYLSNLLIKSNIIQTDNSRDIVSNIYPKPDYKIDINKDIKVDETLDVSVIIPVYNYKDLISECIDSVLNQKTKYRYEIILVDDGSTDGASEICDTYKKYANVVVIHQKNSGIGGARNTGLNHAKGKYIMFVDCDDFVHSDFIEIMMNEAYATNNDIIICGFSLIKKQNGKVVSSREMACSPNNIMGYKEKEDLIMNYPGLPWNKIYKRETFDDIRYVQGLWYEDTITHFLIFRKCRSFSYVNKSLYDYMWYEKNFSHTQTKIVPKSLERYWFLEIMAEESIRIGIPLDKGFYKVLLRHSGRLLYSGIYGFEKEVKESAFLLASALLKKYKPDEHYSLTFFEKKLEKALLEGNISKWENVCKYI